MHMRGQIPPLFEMRSERSQWNPHGVGYKKLGIDRDLSTSNWFFGANYIPKNCDLWITKVDTSNVFLQRKNTSQTVFSPREDMSTVLREATQNVLRLALLNGWYRPIAACHEGYEIMSHDYVFSIH